MGWVGLGRVKTFVGWVGYRNFGLGFEKVTQDQLWTDPQKHATPPTRVLPCRIWSLGVVLDRRLTFHKHVSIVARSCNSYHAQAIRHIRHLLTTELAQTLACSLILSRIDYCNAVLHGAPTGTVPKLQRVQNNAARIVLQAPRRFHAKSLLHQLHWLPVQQRIAYKLAVLTYKVRTMSTPVYLHRRIAERACSRTLRSAAIPLLFMRTDFGKIRKFSPPMQVTPPSRGFRFEFCDIIYIHLYSPHSGSSKQHNKQT